MKPLVPVSIVDEIEEYQRNKEDKQALLRVVRAAGKLIAIAPENDLYYALNKYCCEHMDEMIKALKALPEHLRDA